MTDVAQKPIGGQVFAWLGVAVLAAAAMIGSNVSSIRDRIVGSALPEPVVPVTSRVVSETPAGVTPERTALRSAPWWQTVTVLEGTGTTELAPFNIDARAIQWRVTGSCGSGRLSVRSPQQAQFVVDAACPQAIGYGDQTGATTLEVKADGPWRLEIAQRIDSPLSEPPLATMAAAGTTTVATGSFYKLDQSGTGKLTIYSQADGRYSVRLQDFWVSPKSSLQLRLSTARSPQTSEEYLSGRSQLLASMDVTAGSLNYVAPSGVEPGDFQSVVIWSPSTNSAYAAAILKLVAS